MEPYSDQFRVYLVSRLFILSLDRVLIYMTSFAIVIGIGSQILHLAAKPVNSVVYTRFHRGFYG